MTDLATIQRAVLGLGTAATQNTGTSGAAVPLLNAANTWAAAQTFSAGIIFANETLSTYDEGAWTITFTCGTSGTITLDATTQGRFIRIGNFVHLFGYVTGSTVSSPMGTLTIGTFPFTASNINASIIPFLAIPTGWAATLTSPLLWRGTDNATSARAYKYAATGGMVDTAIAADFPNGTSAVMYFQGSYPTVIS